MYALHHLIGLAVGSVNRWRGSRMSMQDVVKEMELFGVLCSEDKVANEAAFLHKRKKLCDPL